MFRYSALIGLIAAPAAAGVSNCRHVSDFDSGAIYCDVSNDFDTAIAAIDFIAEIFETGRTVPWVVLGDDRTPRGTSIPGGIEPGETRDIFFWTARVPDEANAHALETVVTPIRYLDVHGAEISSH